MTVTLDPWRTKRTDWTKVRDGAGVKKGAVSGVSLGDRLDALHKSGAKGYRPLLAAIAALKKDVKTYQTKGGKAVAPVNGWFKTLGDDLDTLQRAAEADVDALTKLGPYLVNFHQLAVPGIADAFEVTRTMKVIEKDTTGKTTWADAAGETGLYRTLPTVLNLWVDTIKHLQALKFQVKLPTKDPYYAYLDSLDAEYMKGYKVLVAFKKVQSAEDHLNLTKSGNAPIAEIDHSVSKTNAAIKALLA